MKYKVGDKVKIKTWEELEKEYGVGECGDVIYRNKEILTIESVKINHPNNGNSCYYYKMKEADCYWSEEMIKRLVEVIPDLILNRFEILDLRGYE